MKKASWVLAGLLSTGVLGLPAYVRAGTLGNGAWQRQAAARKETNVDFKDLPQVVQDAVVTASGGSKVHCVTQYIDTVNGKLHYHVVAGNGVVRQTFVLDEGGKLLMTKDKVGFESLPDPVKETMSKNAGPGKILDSVEKATDPVNTYYIGAIVQKGGLPDKVIRVGEDGTLVSGIPEDDIQLRNEKFVPLAYRILRTDINTETMKVDDLPGAVKATIAVDAKSDPVDNVMHLMPGGNAPDAYVATIGVDAATQRKFFVNGNGDALDGAGELGPYALTVFAAQQQHHGR